MIVPQITVSVGVASDKHLASDDSGQIRQISDCEVAVAWDINREGSDIITTQNDMDCDCLEGRVNLN